MLVVTLLKFIFCMLGVPLLKIYLLYAGCPFVCWLPLCYKCYLLYAGCPFVKNLSSDFFNTLHLSYNNKSWINVFFFLSFRFNIFKVVGLHLESVSDNISQLYTIVHSQVHTEEVFSPCLCQTDIKIYFHIWHKKYILMYDIIIPFSKTCKINC